MTHQPYETWIFSDEPLPPDARQDLEAHLHTCPRCRQLSIAQGEIEVLLRAAPVVGPGEGFVERWKTRLGDEQARRARRQVWLVLGLNAGATALLAVLLMAGWLVFSPSPLDMIALQAYRFTLTLSLLEIGREVLLALIEVSPPLWWVSFLGAVSFLSLAWLLVVSGRPFSAIRRLA